MTNKKYEIHDHITGQTIQVDTFDDIKNIQSRLREEWYKSIESMFRISVLIKNEDDSWTQYLAKDDGEPLIIEMTP